MSALAIARRSGVLTDASTIASIHDKLENVRLDQWTDMNTGLSHRDAFRQAYLIHEPLSIRSVPLQRSNGLNSRNHRTAQIERRLVGRVDKDRQFPLHVRRCLFLKLLCVSCNDDIKSLEGSIARIAEEMKKEENIDAAYVSGMRVLRLYREQLQGLNHEKADNGPSPSTDLRVAESIDSNESTPVASSPKAVVPDDAQVKAGTPEDGHTSVTFSKPLHVDLRIDDSFVLRLDAPIDEDAIVLHVNQKPVKVKDLLAEASTTVLLKPIPGMDELERHRLVANEIQRVISLYAFEEVFLQHFNAELPLSDRTELDQAIAERDASISKDCLRSLADIHDFGGQQQVLRTGLNDCLKANRAAEEIFSRLSRSTRVSQQLVKSPSMDHSTIELVTSRCNQLLIETRLRTVVSLRFNNEDFFTAVGSIAKKHGLNIVLKPERVTIHRGQSPSEEFKLTYQCEDKLLSEAITEIIKPLALRWQLSGPTVMIVPDAEAGASRDEDANDKFGRALHEVTTAGTPIDDHIDEPSGVGIASVDSIDEPKVIENEHSLDPHVALTKETRNQVVRRLLSTDRHTPWQIMGGIEGLRRDMLLKNGDTTVNAIEWIQAGPMYRGEPWFQKTEHGGRAHPFSKPYWFEGHVNQFLSKLAACRLPLDATFGTPDGPTTIQDMINHAKMVVNDREEVSWTLLALCRYLPPDAKWTNAKGEKWSIERLVDIEVGKQVGGPTSPNGGTDGLYALAIARNEYLKTGKPLEGVWLKADEKIKKYIDLAKSQQNSDGTLSSDFFRSSMRKDQFDRRLSSTGHLLQFLMHAVSDEQLKEDWIRRAVEATATDIRINRKEYVSCEPLFAATEALTTYLERTQGISLGLVASPLPLNVASQEASATEAVASSDDQPSHLSKLLIGPVPKQNENGATIQKLPAPYFLVVYQVADHVLPVWTGATKADFAPLVELIKATVEPESWRDGQAAITPSNEKLFLVIRQTRQAHEQIAKLLSQLNDDLDQVIIRCRLMKVTSEQQLKGIEDRCSLNAINDHKRWALLTKERTEQLATFLSEQNSQVLLCPSITMFSGTSGAIRIGEQDDGSFSGFNLLVEPRIVVESPIIRLKHEVDFAIKNSAGAAVEATEMDSMAKDESLIGSGQTLLLLINRDGDQVDESLDVSNADSIDRLVLMLTVERLEEEEVPADPSVRK